MAIDIDYRDTINQQVEAMESDLDVVNTNLRNIMNMKKLCDGVIKLFYKLKDDLQGLVRGSVGYNNKLKGFIKLRKGLVPIIEKLLKWDEKGMRLTYRDLRFQRRIEPDKSIVRFLREETTLFRRVLGAEKKIHMVLEHCKKYLDSKVKESFAEAWRNLMFTIHILEYIQPLITHAFNTLGTEAQNIEDQERALKRRKIA